MSPLDSPRRPVAVAPTAPIGPAGRRPGGRSGGRSGERTTRASRKQSPPETDLLAMATSFAALFLEVEAGQRPAEHLARLMAPQLWARLAPVWVRSGPRGKVRTVHGVRDQNVYDAVVVVQRGSRIAALSLRLVYTPAGWRVAEAARPEDRHPPRSPDLTKEERSSFSLVSDGS
jgi:uncharacterized protein DUF6459